jgi:hypothetical protein
MRHVSDDERRTRLARRHAVAPAHRLGDPVAATRAMTVLHATEPGTVYLSLLARVRDLTVADVDRALYEERAVVKQLAMRRTLFLFPRDLLPAAWGSASARVAGTIGTRLAKEVENAGVATDGAAWLEAARRAVRTRLADGAELDARTLREELPEIADRIDIAVGKSYGANVALAPRVLTQLAVEAELVRGRNAGHWRTSRPQWTLMERWLGERPAPFEAHAGWAELGRRWLATFGPGTAEDLRWWLGATAAIVRRALSDVEAVEVSLDDGTTGWLLPDDTDPAPPGEPWAALLPVLDATVMGWKERGFLLGEHGDVLFDGNGNAGTTAWWDGRAVGCWVQDAAGAVHVELLQDPGPAGRAALAVEAARLEAWLGGVRVGTVYPSPAMKRGLAALG